MDTQDERPAKRFKHQSYRESLKSVHVPSTTARSALDDDIADTECHFKLALDHWRQLDLTSVFNNFADRVYPLSTNVALLLHHSNDILAFWLEAIAQASGDTLKTLFDLLQKLLHDLRDTLQSHYISLLEALLRPLSQGPSPDVLSVLLATLSPLFKHLLKTTIPNIEHTWNSFSAALIKCNPEIQRALSEVWASILRRLKGEVRKETLQIMLRDLPSLRDTITWTFVYAFQSVARTLHTCTPPLFEDLLSIYISNNDRVHSEVLLRRLITSLTHHCENPEQFSPFADVLISKYLACNSEERRPLMIALTIMFSVRKGSRLTQKQISSVLLRTIQQGELPSESFMETLSLGVACLTAGDMTVWMGPGRKFIEYSWEHPLFGLKLSETLSALDWGGWNLIELPMTSTHSLRLMEEHLIPTLSLLSALFKAGKFNQFNESTKSQIASHIVKRLEIWKFLEGSIEEINYILSICSVLPASKHEIERIADEALNFTPAGADQIDDPILTKIFGGCLSVLGKGVKTELLGDSKVTRWCMGALKRWPRSLPVLQGLICISERQKITPLIPLGDIYLLLKENILSHIHALRLDTLKLLGSSIIDKGSVNATINLCILGESARLDISGVRERLVRITGLPRILKADDEISVDLTIRWLVAQFKVNLRPVWGPTVKALAEVAQRCGEQIWSFVFQQLEGLLSKTIVSINSHNDSDDPEQEAAETERSWKDPSALKLATIVRGCMELQHKASDIEERFDASNFENRLLETLQEIPSLTERHNADIIRLFLTFASPDLPTKPPRSKLKSWLTLFSKLDNPRAFHKTETLQLLYRSLLSHPDRGLQTLSLTCVLNYKSPHLLPYAEHFHAILDDTRLREHLATFDIDTVQESHREGVFDVLIRLFFGLMLDRHGFNRRAVLLNMIGQCRDEELETLVSLMLAPFLTDAGPLEFSSTSESDGKQELGFLNLLRDVLKRLGSRITAHWPALIKTVIRLVADAQKRITALQSSAERDIKDVQEEREDVEDVNPKAGPHIFRNIRLLGVRCLTDFFRCNVQYDFTPFLPSAFDAIIRPRMALFEQENIQSSSAILELFLIWSSRKEFAPFLVVYDERVLPKVCACLLATNVKPIVITRVFDIIENLIRFAEEDSQIAETVFKPHIQILLSSLMVQLSGDLLHRQISILSRVAQFASDQAQAKRVLSQFVPLLKKPVKTVSEKIKTNILIIVQTLVPLVLSAGSSDGVDGDSNGLSDQLYQVVSMLFQTLRYRSSRLALLSVLKAIAENQVDLQRVSEIIESLNAFSTRRIDEPDFERRLGAYALVNEQLYSELTSREWSLLLYNMLFFIQDPDELIIRTNAAFSVKRFVEVLCTKEDQDFHVIFTKTLFPALKNGLRAKSELVRNEILLVLAFSIQKCQNIDALNELRPLLAQGDVEADFFNNIYHIQIHRRVRALRRLSDHVSSGGIRSTTVSEIFVPIINHFIMNASTTDHILVDVAINALGSMARQLNWGAYNSLVRMYLALVKDKETIQRAFVRALISVLENFHFSMDDDVSTEEARDLVPEDGAEVLPALVNGIDKQKSKVSEAVNTRLLPSLLHYLESRDDNEDALRVPISVGIAQITLHLPASTRDAQIIRLLTIISQVFRSKSFETRKLARDVLCRIIILVGPSYLPTVVTELKTALQRGSHLHILSTVVHTIVDRVTSPDVIDSFKTLDSCATDIANIASEVIFGQSGKDVQSEGFTTTVQEVRGSSSKGIESLVILSRHVTSNRLSSLLNPIKGIMHETAASKTMQLVDDVIRRISAGLSANNNISNSERLSLCHTLIEQNARFLQETQPSREKTAHKDFAVVHTKRQLGKDEDYYTINKYRFVVLGLDLFNVAFRRGSFDLKDPEILSRLETMVPVIGNSLYSQDSSVIIQALKATVFIIKCPLKAVDDSLPVFVKQIMHLVKQASNTESEVVQAAFRTLAVIIRDCSSSRIGEKDLVFLIELLAPDLEEPMRQAAIFGLLRAIVSRRMVIVEIYDLMDKVAEIMVTNQARQVQEMCRYVLLQFLLDYPQGQSRLRKQMAFLTKNLSYPFESGRLSVMELLAAVLTKFDKALLHQYAEMFFVALVMVMANDDSSKCKEMAASLIKLLFDQLDNDKRKDIISRLRVWCSEKSSTRLACVSSQVYGLLVENDKKTQAMDASVIIKDMTAVIDFSLEEFEKFESKASDESVSIEANFSWQLPYHALNTLYKCLREYPECLSGQSIKWEAIYSHLIYPHAWVRNVAAKLVGLLFNAVSPFNPRLVTANDKQFSHINLRQIALNCCIQLKSDTLDSNLGLQVVKNLFFIGKCFALVDQTNESEPAEPENEETLRIEDNPLSWLFSKLSFQIRSNLLARRNRFKHQSNWCEQSLAILHWFAAMTSHHTSSLLQRYLGHMLNPIYRILEDDTIHDDSMEKLKTLATELLDLIQGKVGTTNFSEAYSAIKQHVTMVRQERKAQAAVRTGKDPKNAFKRKIARNLAKKKSRSRKADFLAKRNRRRDDNSLHSKRR